MKILVFSDSHGKFINMQKAIDMHPDAQYLLHLGDGTADLDDINTVNKKIYTVNGNFEDSFFSAQKGLPFQCVEIEGKRIFMCHGHRQRVSYGLQNLCYNALENDADVALYGHTHVKYDKFVPFEQKGLHVFNPGSISRPRDCVYPSYGIIEIQKNGILLSHGMIKG